MVETGILRLGHEGCSSLFDSVSGIILYLGYIETYSEALEYNILYVIPGLLHHSQSLLVCPLPFPVSHFRAISTSLLRKPILLQGIKPLDFSVIPEYWLQTSAIEHAPLTSLTFSSGATAIEANTSKPMTDNAGNLCSGHCGVCPWLRA